MSTQTEFETARVSCLDASVWASFQVFRLCFRGKSGSGKEDRQHLLSASSSVTQNGGG